MTRKQKNVLIRIIIALVLFVGLIILFKTDIIGEDIKVWLEPACFLTLYLLAGYDVLLKAWKNICHGKVFDENFLMIIAGIGAFAIGEYTEGVAVILFYQVGEQFQGYAVGKSRKSISDMMNIVPETANLVDENGNITEADPEDVEVGSTIVIKPGERVPLDSYVLEGESWLDTSALTGESVPRRVSVGEQVISGCVNGKGTLKCLTQKAYEDSTVSRILELVENAGSRKSRTEQFITRFAKYYTPVVTIAALLLAIIPSIITGNWAEWVRRACTFLVISCPCALVISVPMGFFGGIGAASKVGVLVKGSNFLETMSKVAIIAFDKTGTLTKGSFSVTRVVGRNHTAEEVLAKAAAAEQFSTHPIALSIMDAYKRFISGDNAYGKADKTEAEALSELTDTVNVTEVAGHGIMAEHAGKKLLAGNESLMTQNGITCETGDEEGTVVYVAYDGQFYGRIIISDTIKENSRENISAMKLAGIKKTVMLTGDHERTAAHVARECGVDSYFAGLLPADKVSRVEELIGSLTVDEKLAFVGDGINDAPVLMRADLGIAMGSLGSDAAIEAADVVIMDDDLGKIPVTVRIARKTLRIVKQNIVFALGVKFAILILGALGIAGMWLAVFADVGVAVLAILNSMRALKL
ncbi:MAG: heavy metal translocating P-type ATPase [Lachnospiraceae bacterium]|nr:heavy metal translocating P-type ATPase [Lachnospiraceae bacterium]